MDDGEDSKRGKGGQKQKRKPLLTKSLHRRYNACIAARKASLMKKEKTEGASEVLESMVGNVDKEVIHAISTKEEENLQSDDNDDDDITNVSAVSTLWDPFENVNSKIRNKKRARNQTNHPKVVKAKAKTHGHCP